MNNRELLERAAKACGYDTAHPWNAKRLSLDPPVDALCIAGVSTAWNPLNDDGHALHLAVQLNMVIDTKQDGGWSVCASADGVPWIEEPCGEDPYAATRRAIVRVAAALKSKSDVIRKK